MKTLIILSLLFCNLGFAACVITSDKTEVTEVEQVKGPMKKTVTMVAKNAMDAHEIVSITWDRTAEDAIEVAFKNKTTLTLGYSRERYEKLIIDWKDCE